mgnify:CR=1 FL=1
MNTEKALKFLNDRELYKNSYPEDDLQEHIARQMQEYSNEQLLIDNVSITEGKLPLWTNNDVDAAYLMGCINVGGMDALQDELNRLKELGLKPHQAVGKVRGKSGN